VSCSDEPPHHVRTHPAQTHHAELHTSPLYDLTRCSCR
jgi:hypothetical protein